MNTQIKPRRRSSRMRSAVSLVTTLGVGLGLAATGTLSPAQAATPTASSSSSDTYRFVPIRLTVHDIEDGWPDWKDEPRMYYGGAVWADVVSRGGYPGAIPAVNFTGPHMFVDLWERDGGWTDNNHLGFAVITSDLIGQEKLLRFKTSWYDYEIAYKVVKVS